MVTSDESTFSSKPFTFIVQGKALFVHASLISECSQPLDRMINGHLSEAQQGFALLDDIDEATFIRFIRWLYSGDYVAAEHVTKDTAAEHTAKKTAAEAPSNSQTVATTDPIDDDWGGWGTLKKDKKKKKRDEAGRSSLRESFIRWQQEASEENSWTATPRANKAPGEDYTEVFLSHARLYVFAEKYDIQPLRKLALKKLQNTLAIFILFRERVGDIITLMRYVYENTAESKPDAEDIRGMLAHYVGCEMVALEDEMKTLFLDYPDMLTDFLAMFVNRISPSGGNF